MKKGVDAATPPTKVGFASGRGMAAELPSVD
jgi:hypothetical protein